MARKAARTIKKAQRSKGILLIGPLTQDRIYVGNELRKSSVGGVIFYAAHCLARLGVPATALVMLNAEQRGLLEAFPQQVQTVPIIKRYAVSHEIHYAKANPYRRVQRATLETSTLGVQELPAMEYGAFSTVMLGPQYATDFSLESVKHIAAANPNVVSVAQGFVRTIKKGRVVTQSLQAKPLLRHIRTLLINEIEARRIMPDVGENERAQKLAGFGPQEVIITKGRDGALVYDAREQGTKRFTRVAGFEPGIVKDWTGAGGTFFAAYLARRTEGASIESAGAFAAMATTLKLRREGPPQASRAEVERHVGVHRFLRMEQEGTALP